MKKHNSFFFLLMFAVFFSCSESSNKSTTVGIEMPEEKETTTEVNNSASKDSHTDVNMEVTLPSIIEDFLSNTESLKNIDVQNPITEFETAAKQSANKRIAVTKANIRNVLNELKVHKYMVIVVGDHTIVKVVSTADCAPSGSWGACMPAGEGFIKKGDLVKQNDYINNIIGTSESQRRVAYYF